MSDDTSAPDGVAADRRAEAGPARLRFETDAGASRSKWIAGALVVALVGWMGSGYVLPSTSEGEVRDESAQTPPAVAIRRSEAEEVTLYLTAEGQALPDRRSGIPTETSGQIAEVLVRKGQDVDAREVIARIDAAQREADLARARTELERTERDYENARTLLDRGVATVDRVAETRTALAAARAQLAAAEEETARTEIRAPFAGRIETLDIDPGQFVANGTVVAEVVDNTPLTVSIRVPQQALNEVRAGQVAEVRFITGETSPGEVTFVGTAADAETRTFLAEVTVDNPGGTVPAGVSAEVRIPTGTAVAHLLSPAIMSLSSDGVLGIKTLGDEGAVVFNEVEIVRAESEGIWVTGLPEQATILTVGQGFVSEGEQVMPMPEAELDAGVDPVAVALDEATGAAMPDGAVE
ncbi:efflux RND transporter periplasmic adaptor subunit [Jannaschia sp. S6380]|uniref:efflux RND transporter periplasmic adaptor subunit n=1 Tax=Jannaschia sp. S6380 TaxID=2926408 RepID=UPI001FF6170B|nr:efflux RND transporter periplasmic adaptor subunit [Jannaschia sp. S6380]MCK0166349.1 efflux RND transporter periplasmic adaptor subunit [Jannaschia sp. S6380]